MEKRRRSALQRQRRMSRRMCGHCGQQADAMLRWGGQTVAICHSCKSRLDVGHVLPESAYRWRDLQDPGLWCDVDEPRPCEDCAFRPADVRTEGVVTDSASETGRAEPARGRRFIDLVLGRPPR